jgi:hypothetical protein
MEIRRLRLCGRLGDEVTRSPEQLVPLCAGERQAGAERGAGDPLGARRAENHLHLRRVPGDPGRRDRDRRYVVLCREPVDDGVELWILRRTEEHAGEESGLERRPRLDGDVVQAAVVDDAATVEGDRLLFGEHVCSNTLGDDRCVGDRELQLVGDDGLTHVTLQQVDLPRRVVGNSEVAHFSRRLELVERTRDLLGLDEGIGAMQQQDVDAVGLQGVERPVNGLDDVFVREVEVVWIVTASRSAGLSCIASAKRRSHPCSSLP